MKYHSFILLDLLQQKSVVKIQIKSFEMHREMTISRNLLFLAVNNRKIERLVTINTEVMYLFLKDFATCKYSL